MLISIYEDDTLNFQLFIEKYVNCQIRNIAACFLQA